MAINCRVSAVEKVADFAIILSVERKELRQSLVVRLECGLDELRWLLFEPSGLVVADK